MTRKPVLHPQYVIGPDGKRTAVILPWEEYEELLEDLDDLTVMAERRGEETLSHDQVKAELHKDGTLPD